MIRLLERGQEKLLFPFCAGDPFGCRVVTAARAYGIAGKEAEFWFQSVQGNICAVICRVNGECTLYNKPAADWEELDCFLNAIGYRSLFFFIRETESGQVWTGYEMGRKAHVPYVWRLSACAAGYSAAFGGLRHGE